MRIGFLISHLGRGGAERQLMRLAAGLVRRQHQVEVLCYGGASELDQQLKSEGVRVHNQGVEGQWQKIQLARRWLYAFQPDVAHGFMKRASSVVALARIGILNCKVLASDMSSATYGRYQPSLWGSLLVFALADRVVTQTELNRNSLESLAPWLRGRTVVIRNGIDISEFTPTPVRIAPSPFRFCAVGTVYELKNPVRVVTAVAELAKRGVPAFRLDWYGRLGLKGDNDPSPAYQEAIQAAHRLGVLDIITFHGDTQGILRAYQSADGLIHASIQEGFPNAVVEAMACGLPIVVSRVSDLPLVVREARNGFLFDETDPVSIADAMERLIRTPLSVRLEMGQRSRDLAVRWFGQERFINEFERLYESMVKS